MCNGLQDEFNPDSNPTGSSSSPDSARFSNFFFSLLSAAIFEASWLEDI